MSKFESEFLDNYLKFGLGSMPKSDIDALVMSLLDRYGLKGSGPLASLGKRGKRGRYPYLVLIPVNSNPNRTTA